MKFVPIKEFPKVLNGAPLSLNPKPQEPVEEPQVKQDDPNPDDSFEEKMRLRDQQRVRSSTLKSILIPPEPLSQNAEPKAGAKVKPEDTEKLLGAMAKSAGAKARKELQRLQDEESLRAKKASEARAAKDAKNLLAFKKSVVKMKQDAVQRNTLLNFGVTLVNAIMEQFNEDGEEHEKPLNSEKYSEASESELGVYGTEGDFLNDPAEFGLLAMGYQSFRKLEADEKGSTVSLGGFKSLVFLKVNTATKEYKTVKHYPKYPVIEMTAIKRNLYVQESNKWDLVIFGPDNKEVSNLNGYHERTDCRPLSRSTHVRRPAGCVEDAQTAVAPTPQHRLLVAAVVGLHRHQLFG